MKITEKGMGIIRIDNTNQKELVTYISKNYNIPARKILDTIHSARKAGYIWESIFTEKHEIIVYVVKGRMFAGIIPNR